MPGLKMSEHTRENSFIPSSIEMGVEHWQEEIAFLAFSWDSHSTISVAGYRNFPNVENCFGHLCDSGKSRNDEITHPCCLPTPSNCNARQNLMFMSYWHNSLFVFSTSWWITLSGCITARFSDLLPSLSSAFSHSRHEMQTVDATPTVLSLTWNGLDGKCSSELFNCFHFE